MEELLGVEGGSRCERRKDDVWNVAWKGNGIVPGSEKGKNIVREGTAYAQTLGMKVNGMFRMWQTFLQDWS